MIEQFNNKTKKVEKKDEDFDKLIEIDKRVKDLKKEIESLKNKIKREKQFNRKVELNRVLNSKVEEYEDLVDNK